MLIRRKTQERLIFIVGVPRSGTTWLWGILTSHPKVVSLERTDFDPDNPSIVDGKRVTSETGAFLNYEDAYIKDVIREKFQMNQGKVIVEKTPKHIYQVDRILEVFPESTIVHVRRKPQAVISSMKMSTFVKFSDSLGDSITQYRDAMKIIEKHRDNEMLIEVKYEDMIRDTETVVSSLLSDLNLENDVDLVERIVKENTNVSKVDIKGVYRRGEIDSYKEDLSEHELRTIEEELNEFL